MITKESVRINLKGVSSVMIDPEVLAEYKTTIEDLEGRLEQVECDVQAQIGYRNNSEAQVRRIKRYWREEQAKNINYERWRQSL